MGFQRQAMRRTRQRYAYWRADTTYRRRLRQQLWQQRRQRHRWEAQRRQALRSSRRQRRPSRLPRLAKHVWSTMRALDWGRPWRWLWGRSWSWLWGRPWRWLWGRLSSRRPTRRVVVVTMVLILGAGVGYAAFRTVGDLRDGGPSADRARPASDQSPRKRAPGPGLTRPGIFLSVAVNDSGKLEAVERARTGSALRELSLLPPPALDGTRRLPRLEDVQLSADGRSVRVPSTVEVTTVVPLDRPASLIELRYRLVGAAARSRPATPGRARLSLRPALAPTLDDSRAVVHVHGTKVHTLVCVDLPRRAQLCGIDRRGGWRTRRIPTASSSVVALVDLPHRAP